MQDSQSWLHNGILQESDLLRWCNKYSKGHDHISPASDLNKCWEDGLCFCALLYTWFPEKIPVAFLSKDTDEDRLNNLRLAFSVATDAGIDTLLDASSIVDSPEGTYAKEITQYLFKIYDKLSPIKPKFLVSQEWLKKFEEEEKTRKLLELKQRNLMMGVEIEDEIKEKTLRESLLTGTLISMKSTGDLQSRLEAKRIEEALLEKQDEDRLRMRARALIFENVPNEDDEIKRAREKAKKENNRVI